MARPLILVVDSDSEALEQVRAVLTAGGYGVDEAVNGRRALERVMAKTPDVIITEILMGDGDGIELISAVKRARLDCRIIGVTACRYLGPLDLLDLASKIGADAVLGKPVTADTLLAAVARLAR